MARQTRGFSQQQLAGMAGVSRQAVSAVESGHSDPSLRVALSLARALGLSVEQLFGPGEPTAAVTAVSVAPLAGPRPAQRSGDRAGAERAGTERAGGERVTLAPVGDRFVALPLRGDAGASLGFLPAGGHAAPDSLTALSALSGSGRSAATATAPDGRDAGSRAGAAGAYEEIAVHPISPPRPTVVVAGCDPALPLLATPLSLLDPPLAFAWWPCGSGEALRLARVGLVHAAGVHTQTGNGDGAGLPDGAMVVGFTAWREGLALRPDLRSAITGLDAVAKLRLGLVNREPGAEARRLLDRERVRLNLGPADLPGYGTQAAGHLQVASAIAARLADAGVASEPAARAYGLAFVPLAHERFNLVIPAEHAASREAQALLKVLTSPWLLAQLANIPGYDAATCGERFG